MNAQAGGHNTAGLKLPWVYVRRVIAERWHVVPWEVDEAPWHEVEIELRILNLEGAAAQRAQQRSRQ